MPEESEQKVFCALGCDLTREDVSIWDFQRARGTVRALSSRSRSAWPVAFWQIHLGSGERRAVAAAGEEGNAASQPRVLPLDAASLSPLRQAGTGSTQPCVGSATQLDVRSI